MSSTSNNKCRDCSFYESQLKIFKEKDNETKNTRLQVENQELKTRLNQLEQIEMPALSTEK